MFKFSLPLRLLIVVLIAFCTQSVLPLFVQRAAYTLAANLKSLLVFMLPIIIFSSIYQSLVKIRNAGALVVLLVFCTIASTFIALVIGGVFKYIVMEPKVEDIKQISTGVNLLSFWHLNLPSLMPNEIALFIALILGLIKNNKLQHYVGKMSHLFDKISMIFLHRIFIPLLPLFIFGFLIKLIHDGILSNITIFNPKLCLFALILLIAYLLILLLIASLVSKKSTVEIMRNMLPAIITAFSTSSSAATLPFSLRPAELNTNNKAVADLTMPITSNIHMIGDAILIPIMAGITLSIFGISVPDINQYMLFILAFLMAKFSGSGVPGGSIIIMIPVLENTLGFSGEMSALITAFYMILDPIATTGNVIGNNLFVIYFNKLVALYNTRSKIKAG